VALELTTLLRLVLLTAGHLADAFYLVVASAAIHTFIFYKGQAIVHVLLPGPKEEHIIFSYVTAAFALKVKSKNLSLSHGIIINSYLVCRSTSSNLETSDRGHFSPGLGAAARANRAASEIARRVANLAELEFGNQTDFSARQRLEDLFYSQRME